MGNDWMPSAQPQTNQLVGSHRPEFKDVKMQFQIKPPEPNVGREDRLIRAVVAACFLSMSAFGLISTRNLSLISLLFAVSGGYFAWSAAKARCFVYARLAIDTRSEYEAAQQQARAATRAAQVEPARSEQQVNQPVSATDPRRPAPSAQLTPVLLTPTQTAPTQTAPTQTAPTQTAATRRETEKPRSGKVKYVKGRPNQVTQQPPAKQSTARESASKPSTVKRNLARPNPAQQGPKAAPVEEWGHSLLGK